MSTALRKPMSREEFFYWAETQDERYEFDGEQPCLITRGLVGHSRLQIELIIKLRGHLDRSRFEVLGPDAGLATIGQRVRYPDAVVTRGFTKRTDRTVLDPVAVFEVTSPSTSRVDRIIKLREYGAVESIRTYAILETESPAITAFRKDLVNQWTATALTIDDTLYLPDIGIELPLTELYAGFDS